MARVTLTAVVVGALAGAIALIAAASGPPDGGGGGKAAGGEAAASISGGTLPRGYRDWGLVSVAHEEGELNDIRAVLGNDAAIRAFRDGKPVFPDGAIVARLAWRHIPSDENNTIFGRAQSFVAGPPVNGVQFMVKDSKRFASTGGWGFSQFDEGRPLLDAAKIQSCFECHALIKDRDLVFTRYAP